MLFLAICNGFESKLLQCFNSTTAGNAVYVCSSCIVICLQRVGGDSGGQSDEELTRSIAEVYLRVTEDVRRGASQMEDVIATGKVR